jgi:hypothetical protein
MSTYVSESDDTSSVSTSDNNYVDVDNEGSKEIKYFPSRNFASANQSFYVDSVICVRTNGYEFLELQEAQECFDEALDNMYNGVILYSSLKTAIVFPIGMFPKKHLPVYHYDYGHIKATLLIARCDEIPDFFRKCLIFESDKKILKKMFEFYGYTEELN